MRTFCLKFPDKATAHSFLYGEEGEPLYDNIADYSRAGIATQLKTDADGNEYLTQPDDGNYCADIRCEELPAELEPFVIPTPSDEVRKHKFQGE
jgi:hypothetical protein